MIVLSEKKNCSGCGSCANACPFGAISMVVDDEGFLYPQVNDTKCVDCGICERVCPELHVVPDDESIVPATYMAWALDDEIRKQSSSGGVFTVLAEEVIAKGGVVFGAAFAEGKLKHIAVESALDLAKLRGSKYLQSDTGDSFSEVKQLLDSGREVLFSGTPCQVEGLRSFLRKDYDNLFLVDFICHGVPSPKVWDTYLKARESFAGAKVKSISFRDKKKNWQDYSMRIEFDNGSEYSIRHGVDWYMRAFLANLDLRPCCYSCSFKKRNRISDITLADFWGVDGLHPSEDNQKGVSLVFAHSTKGADALHDNDGRLYVAQTDFIKAISYNPSMIKSVAVPKGRDRFMGIYPKVGVEKAAKELLMAPLMVRVYNVAMYMLYESVRIVKKVLTSRK